MSIVSSAFGSFYNIYKILEHLVPGTRLVCDPADAVGRITLVRLGLVKKC